MAAVASGSVPLLIAIVLPMASVVMRKPAGRTGPERKFPNQCALFGKAAKFFSKINGKKAGWRAGQSEAANTYILEIATS